MVAGNVVLDRTPAGGWVPGGPALYAARMAHALGVSVRLVTGLPAGYDREVLEGLCLIARPTNRPCRYANSYDAEGNRSQLLLDPGEHLSLSTGDFEGARACLIAPGYHEFESLPAGLPRFVGVSLQGALRSTDEAGVVIPHPQAAARSRSLLRPGAFAFFSEEDAAEPVELARRIAAEGATAILTRGYRGAVLFDAAAERHFPAVPADAIDPTGAGDCFATAFIVRLAETEGDVEEAMRFALAAGSLAVERAGLAGVSSRSEVEQRLKQEAA